LREICEQKRNRILPLKLLGRRVKKENDSSIEKKCIKKTQMARIKGQIRQYDL